MRLLRNRELIIYYIRRTVYPKHSIGRVASWDHEESVPVKVLGHLHTIFCRAVVGQKPIFTGHIVRSFGTLAKLAVSTFSRCDQRELCGG